MKSKKIKTENKNQDTKKKKYIIALLFYLTT